MTDTSGEIQAEGVSNLTVTAPANTDTTPLVPELNQPAPKPDKPTQKTGGTKKNQIAALNQRFQHFRKFTAGGTPTETWTNVTINPSTITGKGEAFNLPWRRNVWTSGSTSMGYLSTLQVQVHVARPPQVSGTIQFRDGNNDLATTYCVDFGGRIDFPLVPTLIDDPQRPRHWNSPWMRTDEASCTLGWRLIAFNRTADIADVTVDIYIRPGSSIFNTPIKPKVRAPSALASFAQMYRELVDESVEVEEQGDIVHYDHPDDDQDEEQDEASDEIAPGAVDSPEEGMVNFIEHQDDELDQDDYSIRVWEGTLQPGVPMAIPLNLSVLVDVSTISDETTIGQKFERFAHVMPTCGGDLGPEIGTYTVHTRLPTGVAASLAHCCLPDDLSDEVAARIFGLSKVLDIATSALSSLGGPLLSGFVQTAPKLVESVLPGPLGGIAGKVAGLAGGILGGKPSNTSEKESSSPSAIGGKIPIARFLEFLKPVAANVQEDPCFSTLLLEMVDSFGDLARAAVPIPAAVYVRMNGKTDRSVWNRTVVPRDSITNTVWIPQDRVGYLIEEFGNNRNTFVSGTHQNKCFKQLLSVLSKKTDFKSISLDEVMADEVSPDFADAVQRDLSSRNFNALINLVRPEREGTRALGPVHTGG